MKKAQFLAQAIGFPGKGQVDHLGQGEPPAARRAVGQPHRLGLGEHLEPAARRVRRDGQDVPQHRGPVGQVALLVTAVETDLPLAGDLR